MNKFPWPTRGDKVFVNELGQSAKAFDLRWMQRRNGEHAEAFKLAGDVALDSCLADDSHDYYDHLIFPVVYLYRHSFELLLKSIVECGDRLDMYDRNEHVQEALRGHNLHKLWILASAAITLRWPDGNPEVTKSAGVVVLEMHSQDKTGQTWRYPRDSNGRPHSGTQLPDRVSVEHLRSAIDGTYSFLDACQSGLWQSLEDMLDYRR